MSEPLVVYRDYLGRRRVIVEVVAPPMPTPKGVRRHAHGASLDGTERRVEHAHSVDLASPEHIHPPEEDGVA